MALSRQSNMLQIMWHSVVAGFIFADEKAASEKVSHTGVMDDQQDGLTWSQANQSGLENTHHGHVQCLCYAYLPLTKWLLKNREGGWGLADKRKLHRIYPGMAKSRLGLYSSNVLLTVYGVLLAYPGDRDGAHGPKTLKGPSHGLN